MPVQVGSRVQSGPVGSELQPGPVRSEPQPGVAEESGRASSALAGSSHRSQSGPSRGGPGELVDLAEF